MGLGGVFISVSISVEIFNIQHTSFVDFLLSIALKISRLASGLFLLASAHFLSALAYHVLD
jgi:hypothetical protein